MSDESGIKQTFTAGGPKPAKHFLATIYVPMPMPGEDVPAQYALTMMVKVDDISAWFVATEAAAKKAWDEDDKSQHLPKIMKDGPYITLLSVIAASESAILSWPYEIEIFPKPAES